VTAGAILKAYCSVGYSADREWARARARARVMGSAMGWATATESVWDVESAWDAESALASAAD
jgi:hypothetical protein